MSNESSAEVGRPLEGGWRRFGRWFGPDLDDEAGHLWPRWLFLRALGAIFFSAFYSLYFQIRGLIGAHGILPAGEYLAAVREYAPGLQRFHLTPTVFWLGGGDTALVALTVAGMIAAGALTLNLAPRASCLVCELLFLSAIAVLQVFASYQSDGMLLEAGFVALFFAPRGLRPGLGTSQPPSRASRLLLLWEWFRIYFESGVVKLASGDPQWRDLTAMDHYYENGPLPTWIGWWAHQLPHGWHAFTALFTLVVELALVWMAWLPRRFRIATFFVVTPLQIGIILTANYAFLNYLVLVLGILLLDDRFLSRIGLRSPASVEPRRSALWRQSVAAVTLTFVFVASVVAFAPLPRALRWPARVLSPFRIASAYGLFAVMTRARYEIEFQGTVDGEHWLAYPFRCKPQDPGEAPGIYAPYQPRFEWNLWFASLSSWRANTWVVATEARLAEGSPAVLELFRDDPFAGSPPRRVRAVRWQYWFTDRETRRRTGAWWRREELGPFGPAVERTASGELRAVSSE